MPRPMVQVNLRRLLLLAQEVFPCLGPQGIEGFLYTQGTGLPVVTLAPVGQAFTGWVWQPDFTPRFS